MTKVISFAAKRGRASRKNLKPTPFVVADVKFFCNRKELSEVESELAAYPIPRLPY